MSTTLNAILALITLSSLISMIVALRAGVRLAAENDALRRALSHKLR